MSINTSECYVEIGSSVNSDYSLNNSLSLPAPDELPFSPEFMADAERNADGTMMIQQIGRTQYTTQLKWSSMRNKKWWEINRWFNTYGYVFYMKYFDHADGKVKIQRFYRGNMDKGTPSTVMEVINGYAVPVDYRGVGFSIIDMGESDVTVLLEVSINE